LSPFSNARRDNRPFWLFADCCPFTGEGRSSSTPPQHGYALQIELTYGDAANQPELVWEYINPVTEDGIKQIITDQYPMYNSVFRAYRYTADHPALKGKTLSGTLTITGKVPQYLKGGDLLTGLASPAVTTPQEVALLQNYPNPFNPSTSISFSLQQSAYVSLEVFNMLGEELATLIAGELQAGTHRKDWIASGMVSGTYLYTLRVYPLSNLASIRLVQTRKMLLLR
jgi:hypothetical protein